MPQVNKVKKHRLHHEGTPTLLLGALVLLLVLTADFYLLHPISPISAYVVGGLFLAVYAVIVNFFRCPVRVFPGETIGTIVAPCDGKVVVIEEVEENEYFHDRRLMVSIFMSVLNVHANWVPANGVVKYVRHHSGAFHKAWLPKASTENERSTVVISTDSGEDILVRQVAGAMARRIVTYLDEGQECSIDNHLGFIKFGSRVDIYLPVTAEVKVEMGQLTTGNGTVIAQLAPRS